MFKKIFGTTDFFKTTIPFYISVFVSAFLLFQVQPLIGKYILPWFGGGSSVWTSTVLFFELLLLFGYGYAYFLTRLSLRRQIQAHMGMLSASAFLLIVLFFFWESPITPPLALRPPDALTPVIQVLAVLGLSVGLPYFLLSTTSSLLQRWFSLSQSKLSPYPLYSLSNAGSLLGLVTYPFLVEVLLPLRVQGILWALGFLVFVALLFISARTTLKNASVQGKTAKSKMQKTYGITTIQPYLWIFFPMASSMILLSTTSQITQSVAPAPFLWILPLGLYLFSFILVFSSKKLYWRNIYAVVLLLVAPLTIIISLNLQSFITNLAVYTIFIFVSYMVLHGELYLSRPDPENLNLFYFLEALGSVIGGVFVALISPIIFNDFWEFYIAAFLTVGVAITLLFTHKQSPLYRLFSDQTLFTRFSMQLGVAVSILCAFFGFAYIFTHMDTYLVSTRNFYGLVSVVEVYDEQGRTFLRMNNGRINHGGQYVEGDLRYRPVSYFGDASGISYAIQNHQNTKEAKGLHIGVTGLGVGTIASFGKVSDRIDFYEINPEAVKIAREYFTYLSDSKARVSVFEGDARISMQELAHQKDKKLYDIIVLDAFVDDAIPMHLITKEAVDTYLQILDKENGVLAINISNKYLDLGPTIAKLAEALSMQYVIIDSYDDVNSITSASWAILTKDSTFFDGVTNVRNVRSKPDTQNVQLWTDDYSNLFQALYL